jgi:hypothetical protein
LCHFFGFVGVFLNLVVVLFEQRVESPFDTDCCGQQVGRFAEVFVR